MNTSVKWLVGSTLPLLLAVSSFAQTTIEDHNSERLLGVGNFPKEGSPVLLTSKTNFPRKQWRILPLGNGFARIQLGQIGLVLTAVRTRASQHGCPVVLSKFKGGTNQQWRIVPHGNMTIKPHTITNRAGGLVLGVGTRTPRNAYAVVLSAVNAASYRYWHLLE